MYVRYVIINIHMAIHLISNYFHVNHISVSAQSSVVITRFAHLCSLIVNICLLSESISNIHCGYFRLLKACRLDAAKLAVSLATLWSRTKLLATRSTLSTISLRHLPRPHDVFFTIVLSACIHGTLAR